MFKQFIQNVVGADIPMMASLLIFFLFFVAVILYLVWADKAYLKRMSELPLESDGTIDCSNQS
ncbi:MAG: hypothetical protein EAZ32_05035 [Cytophagia bacterium]|jgi:hypothetical protein|nr:MAG: hypothetical protein EAZ38_07455 [Cytophagales bacterium]TAG40924.1 MAG: hypothetical protein EAZ32_05035 [Cytophagia bacterium]TAG82541.1 MAG: hypothetical protein EAZ22_04905 [Cytophagales bacterium]